MSAKMKDWDGAAPPERILCGLLRLGDEELRAPHDVVVVAGGQLVVRARRSGRTLFRLPCREVMSVLCYPSYAPALILYLSLPGCARIRNQLGTTVHFI